MRITNYFDSETRAPNGLEQKLRKTASTMLTGAMLLPAAAGFLSQPAHAMPGYENPAYTELDQVNKDDKKKKDKQQKKGVVERIFEALIPGSAGKYPGKYMTKEELEKRRQDKKEEKNKLHLPPVELMVLDAQGKPYQSHRLTWENTKNGYDLNVPEDGTIKMLTKSPHKGYVLDMVVNEIDRGSSRPLANPETGRNAFRILRTSEYDTLEPGDFLKIDPVLEQPGKKPVAGLSIRGRIISGVPEQEPEQKPEQEEKQEKKVKYKPYWAPPKEKEQEQESGDKFSRLRMSYGKQALNYKETGFEDPSINLDSLTVNALIALDNNTAVHLGARFGNANDIYTYHEEKLSTSNARAGIISRIAAGTALGIEASYNWSESLSTDLNSGWTHPNEKSVTTNAYVLAKAGVSTGFEKSSLFGLFGLAGIHYNSEEKHDNLVYADFEQLEQSSLNFAYGAELLAETGRKADDFVHAYVTGKLLMSKQLEQFAEQEPRLSSFQSLSGKAGILFRVFDPLKLGVEAELSQAKFDYGLAGPEASKDTKSFRLAGVLQYNF